MQLETIKDSVKLSFKDFTFEELNDKIKVNFLKIFYFYLSKADLKKISDFTVEKNSILFENTTKRKAEHKFNFLLTKGFNDLTNKISGRRTIYIHKNSGIPLMGSLYFGIIDRGSNLLVLRPLTSCNMNCIFCSVDEGLDSKRKMDFVIEKDYLVEETKKLIEFKNKKIDIYINPQGEPLLYADLIPLIKGLSKINNINIISIITNGTLLNEKLIDDLVEAGLNQVNLSLNAAEEGTAIVLEGTQGYNHKRVLEMARYLSDKVNLIIAPVLMPGYNEKDMEKLAELAKKLKAQLLIQKFLINKKGRNPIKEPSWDYFYDLLGKLERKHKIKLIANTEVYETEELPLPFRKGDTINVKVICNGVHQNEKLATSENRVLSILNCNKEGYVNVNIIRSKNNIFLSKLIKKK